LFSGAAAITSPAADAPVPIAFIQPCAFLLMVVPFYVACESEGVNKFIGTACESAELSALGEGKASRSLRSTAERSRKSLNCALALSEHLSLNIVVTFRHDLLPSVLHLIRAEE
jgi:hypothetical protein